MSIGYILMSRVAAVWQLYLCYGVIIGLAMGGTYIPLVSPVTRWFIKRRTAMTGIVLSGQSAGVFIAPLVSSFLIASYDWRVSYIILGGIILVIAVSIAQLLRRDPAQMRQEPYGGDGEAEHGWNTMAEGYTFKEAVVTRQFWLFLTMVTCYGTYLFAIMIHIIPHITELGISPATAANILAILGGMGIIGRLTLGSIADKIGNRNGYLIGLTIMSLALFWLISISEIWQFYIFAAVFGFANGGAGVSGSPFIATLFGLRAHGFILGAAASGFTVGGAIGPLLTGYIFDVTGSYQMAFLIAAIIGIVSIILVILIKPIKARQSRGAMVK